MTVYIGSFSEIYDEEGIARTLEHLGQTVKRYEERGFCMADVQDILSLKPDFVLFAKLKVGQEEKAALVEGCKKAGIKTVCWVPDLYFGVARQVLIKRDPIFRADVVCTPDGGNDEKWKSLGINHKLLRQGIYQLEALAGEKQPLNFEIVFVGSRNPEFRYRTHLMNALEDRYGYRFRWIGKTHTKQARGQQLNDMFASVKVVIGDSFFSPHYWSNRIYETLGRGGFLIHPRIQGLEEEYLYYKHFVPYDYGDFTGLFEKIEHYLSHDDERKAIQEAGFAYTKEHHTLTNRCQDLLTFVS